ncbi:MAG: AmmeMemoRadiSam system radical SAM enzyme [Oscillospiraceae bacterium]|nr:AmmeMemoRadiSam system radical SAM enzyme [Oscillospiraceae bacterium]
MCEKTVCGTCFRRCSLSEGRTGFCRARKNEGGKIVCVNYGKITSMALDPIEKKPLACFYPGSKVLSVGSFGCNLDCPFCQNADISRDFEDEINWKFIAPDDLARLAAQYAPRGNIGLAFTYNEPMVGWEYVRDAARCARALGFKCVVVTNGTVSAAALSEVLPYIDAFNIDLKGFTREWYQKIGGDLDMTLDFIRGAAKSAHVELTTLIVPGKNDGGDEMRDLAEWVASVDRSIPLHITRFFPRRNMKNSEPTDIALMRRLAGIAGHSLDTVLLGNV